MWFLGDRESEKRYGMVSRFTVCYGQVGTHVPAMVFPSFIHTRARGVRGDEMTATAEYIAEARNRAKARMLIYLGIGRVELMNHIIVCRKDGSVAWWGIAVITCPKSSHRSHIARQSRTRQPI